MEKAFFLSNSNGEALYIQLYRAITREIHHGNLRADEKMPSVRMLSKSMNLSKTTVESAYSQLIAEGYMYSKPQVGYFVKYIEDRDNANYRLMFQQQQHQHYQHHYQQQYNQQQYEQEQQHQLRQSLQNSQVSNFDLGGISKHESMKQVNEQVIDFVSEYVEHDNFDMKLWKRSINHVIHLDEYKLFSSAEAFGEKELKEAISVYFARTRGIHALPHQILIGAGTSSLLQELAHVFSVLGYTKFAIENPGYNAAKNIFAQDKFDMQPITLKDHVLDIESVRSKGKTIIFTSPSYQFPYGEIMPIKTRFELIDYAQISDSYIIEDDFNNELRYIGKPVTSLQGMDEYGRVIYLGAFSTILLPSIKISFVVLPEVINKVYNKIFKDKIQGTSKLEQLALANMIQSGDFSRHIRKLRKNYRHKYQYLKQLCHKHLQAYCHIILPDAGLMVILELKKAIPKDLFSTLCQQRALKIACINDFMIEEKNQQSSGIATIQTLVLNYRGINESDLEIGILKVKELICQH